MKPEEFNQVSSNGFCNLTNLVRLNLWSQCTVIYPGAFDKLVNIEYLDISDSNVFSADIQHLRGLTYLNVANTNVTDGCFDNMHDLETLNIGGTLVTDNGISHLRELVNLTMGPLITDAGISPMKKLEYLGLEFRTLKEEDERWDNGPYFKLETIMELDRLSEIDGGILSEDDEETLRNTRYVRFSYDD
jgi:hypothetical protein